MAAAKGADATARARQLYTEATTHYNLGEYQQALASFQDGYRLRPDAAFLFNIAQCHRQLNQPEEAARTYKAYLRESPGAPNRDEVVRLIAEMDRLAAERAAPKTVVTPPPSEEKPAPPTVAPVVTPSPPPTPPPSSERKKKPAWVWITVGAVGAVAVGLGVGLGVGLTQHVGAPDTTLGTYQPSFQ